MVPRWRVIERRWWSSLGGGVRWVMSVGCWLTGRWRVIEWWPSGGSNVYNVNSSARSGATPRGYSNRCTTNYDSVSPAHYMLCHKFYQVTIFAALKGYQNLKASKRTLI